SGRLANRNRTVEQPADNDMGSPEKSASFVVDVSEYRSTIVNPQAIRSCSYSTIWSARFGRLDTWRPSQPTVPRLPISTICRSAIDRECRCAPSESAADSRRSNRSGVQQLAATYHHDGIPRPCSSPSAEAVTRRMSPHLLRHRHRKAGQRLVYPARQERLHYP